MQEEFTSDLNSVEYEEDIVNEGPVKNKYETGEVRSLQKAIQEVTSKIEQEKIKLRITDERLEAKKNQYNQLLGKPVQKTEEEKEREHKAKLEETKRHKLETTQKKKKVNKAEEFRLIQRKQYIDICRQEVELEGLIKSINETNLKIDELKLQIANLRKRKVAHDKQLNKLTVKNEQLKEETDKLKEINDKGFENIEKIDMERLAKKKEKGVKQEKEFQEKRDVLEDQYHKIIETNIQRERERKKEQAKKRQMLGIMAKQVMKQKNKSKEDDSIEEQIKKLKSEEICDRIPILDLIIEKWKNINKTKKQMLKKYNKNSEILKKSLELIKKFLGVEDYSELPIIYKKTEEQFSSVQMYICNLLNTKHTKEEQKDILIEQIKILEKNQEKDTNDKSNFLEEKKRNIEKLKNHISRIKNEIEEKRDFFGKLQPMSEKFLNRLNETYVGEYIPNKLRSLNMKYNESNIKNVFDNISNYYKLIIEIEKSFDMNKTDNSNKVLESLGNEFRNTLENFRIDGNGNLNSKLIKFEPKTSEVNYSKEIKKISENLINNMTRSQNMNRTTRKVPV
jgi:hypothetical protein